MRGLRIDNSLVAHFVRCAAGIAGVGTFPVHIHDMQATILNLCCRDNERLTERYQDGKYRLTDIHGNVQDGLVAYCLGIRTG